MRQHIQVKTKRWFFALVGAAACLGAAVLAEPFLQRAAPLASRTSALLFSRSGVSQPPEQVPAPTYVPHSSDLRERLRREGAKPGDIQVSLAWNGPNDLDLHVVDPTGERIFYQNMKAASGGELDVDMNAIPEVSSNEPVEHIYFPHGQAPAGNYQVFVHHFANHGGKEPTSYVVEVLANSHQQRFTGIVTPGTPPKLITEIEVAPGRIPEFQVPRSRVAPGRSRAVAVDWTAFWWLVLLVGAYAALLAAFLAGLLVVGQRWLLRRWPLASRRQVLRLLLGAPVAGFLAGSLGQAFFGVCAAADQLPGASRPFAFLLLGLVMGWGLGRGRCVPHLPAGLAALAGAAGGLAGGLMFSLLQQGSEVAGRFAASALLGLCIGMAVPLAILLIQRPTPRPYSVLPRRSLPPQTLRPHGSRDREVIAT